VEEVIMAKIYKPKIEVLPSSIGSKKRNLSVRKKDRSGAVARARREAVKTSRLAAHGV